MQTADEIIELLRSAVKTGRVVIVPSTASPAGAPPLPPIAILFGLTRAENGMLTELMEHGYVPREQLHAATAVAGVPLSTIKTVEVHICHLRRKLAVHGVTIETVWGRGYQLTDAARERIRELLVAHDVTTPSAKTIAP
jgi:DNA-binding response OmpR family regulator